MTGQSVPVITDVDHMIEWLLERGLEPTPDELGSALTWVGRNNGPALLAALHWEGLLTAKAAEAWVANAWSADCSSSKPPVIDLHSARPAAPSPFGGFASPTVHYLPRAFNSPKISLGIVQVVQTASAGPCTVVEGRDGGGAPTPRPARSLPTDALCGPRKVSTATARSGERVSDGLWPGESRRPGLWWSSRDCMLTTPATPASVRPLRGPRPGRARRCCRRS
jgi:hypothetical protein